MSLPDYFDVLDSLDIQDFEINDIAADLFDLSDEEFEALQTYVDEWQRSHADLVEASGGIDPFGDT